MQALDLSAEIELGEQMNWGIYSDMWRGKLGKAKDRMFDVVIKTFRVRNHNKSSTDPVAERLREHFQEKVIVWEKLQHQNLVPLFGFMSHPSGLPALIYQWYPNGNLVEYLASQPNPNRHSLAINVIDALQYLHSIPAVHGNIKGENVLINSLGVAIMGDYGTAQFLNTGFDITGLDTHFEGTRRYLSPELFKDESRSTMTDMWAMGCLIVFILTDQIPYQNITNHHTLYNEITSGPPPNTNPDGTIHELLWNCLAKCWSKTPKDRPSIADLASCLIPITALKNLRFSEHLEMGYGQVSYAQFSPDGKYLAVGSDSFFGPIINVSQLENGSFTARERFSVSNHSNPSYSGPLFAWSSQEGMLMEYAGKSIHVWQIKEFLPMILVKSQDVIEAARWLSRGTEVMYTTRDQVVVMSIRGETRLTCTFPPMTISGMTVIPGTPRILFIAQRVKPPRDFKIIVYNATESKVEREIPLDDRSLGITLSKDGRYVLVTLSKSLNLYKVDRSLGENSNLSFSQAYRAGSDSMACAGLFGGVGDQFVIGMSNIGHVYFWDRDSSTLLHSIQLSQETVIPKPKYTGLAWNHVSTNSYMLVAWMGRDAELWTTNAQPDNTPHGSDSSGQTVS